MKKITFLYTHPIQYFAPLLKKINESDVCSLNVLYCQDTSKGYQDKEFGQKIKWDTPLLEGYDYEFLPESNLNIKGGFFKYFNPAVRKYITKKKTDILVIHGWSNATTILALFYAYFRGIEIWLRSESPYCQEIKKSKFILGLKKIILKYFLFKMVDKFLYIGEENRRFYKYNGIKDSKLIFTPYSVDNERLGMVNSKYSNIHKSEFKKRLGITEDSFVVLFSGKLIGKKNPIDLLKAFHKSKLEKSILLFIGDGVLMSELKKYVTVNKLENNIIFVGFINQTELYTYFLAADLFVLPSGMNETLGLVVNEAMNYSLPIIVSDLVGCVTDLVKIGENGYTYNLGDINQLSFLLKKVYQNREWQIQAGKKSFEIVKGYSYNMIIDNIKQIISV